MSDLQRLLDENALRALALRYADCVDICDRDGLAALFTEDAVICGSGVDIRGGAQIRKIPDRLTAQFDLTYHAVLNHLVSVAGDVAEGKVYSQAHHVTLAPDGSGADLIMTITYRDHCVRRGAAWLFDRRTLEIRWIETATVQIGSRSGLRPSSRPASP